MARKLSRKELDLIKKSAAQQGSKGGQTAEQSIEIEKERKKEKKTNVIDLTTHQPPINITRPKGEYSTKIGRKIADIPIVGDILGYEPKTGMDAALLATGGPLGTGAKSLFDLGISKALSKFAVPTAQALGTRVGSILHTASIHHWSRQTGMLVAKKGITISKVPIIEKAARVGQPAVNKLFQAATNLAARNVAINQKTTALATSALSKSFSTRALAIYGAWAGSVFLGKWGQAEAAEPITIPLRDALRQAQETGDWSIYDEYSEAANEIANVSMWENIISYSPFSAIPGILAKMKGVKEGIELIDAIAEKAKAEEAKKALEEPEPTFAEERAAADEEARQRDLAEMQWKSQYYALIREGKFEEADALLQEEIKGI